MRTVRSIAGVLALGVLPVVLGACSSGSGGSGAAGSSGGSGSGGGTSAAPSAGPSTPDANAGLPTGTQLKGTLVTSGIPSGYAVDGSGSVDTGASFQQPSPSPDESAKPGCESLEGTAWIDISGYYAVSFAQNDYVNKSSAEEFAQEVDAYQGSTAQDVMTALGKLDNTCGHFTDSQTKSTVKVSVKTGTALGDQDVIITLSDPSWQGNMTLEAVRVGHSVVAVLNSTNSDSASYAGKLASAITANVEKLG